MEKLARLSRALLPVIVLLLLFAVDALAQGTGRVPRPQNPFDVSDTGTRISNLIASALTILQAVTFWIGGVGGLVYTGLRTVGAATAGTQFNYRPALLWAFYCLGFWMILGAIAYAAGFNNTVISIPNPF